MPNKCCIPSCQSSLEKKTIPVFRFPSEKTEREERGKWVEVVKTNVENFKLGSDTVICERHWPINYEKTTLMVELLYYYNV